jgi:uncharacterized membrane protein YdjX (TVP38/TMEM64 family)
LTPSKIAQALYDTVHALSLKPYGWLVLGAALVVVSFPPLFGHTTIIMLCGFAYGMKGFWIAAAASQVGASVVFVTLRYLFRSQLRRWSKNEKWAAFESVILAKGLPLIILIRACPLPPWVWSNTLFASIEVVPLWKFIIATCFTFPKLALHVFVGSRMAALSDGEQRKEMDGRTKAINGSLVGGGIVLTICASWLVYKLVKNHIRQLKEVPSDVDELAAEYVEDFNPLERREDAPLLGSPRG